MKEKATPEADAAQDTAVEVPVAETPLFVGQFSPAFGFDFNTLVELIAGFGLLTTPVFSSKDQQGNLLSADGQMVLPAYLARHFAPAKVQRTDG